MLTIPLIRCDDQAFNKAIKQEYIDFTEHIIVNELLQKG